MAAAAAGRRRRPLLLHRVMLTGGGGRPARAPSTTESSDMFAKVFTSSSSSFDCSEPQDSPDEIFDDRRAAQPPQVVRGRALGQPTSSNVGHRTPNDLSYIIPASSTLMS